MAMHDAEDADPQLLALLRQSLGLAIRPAPATASETYVLKGAEHIYNHSIDVALDSQGTKAAAESIWRSMQQKEYSTKTWASHDLHPQNKDEQTVDFIFTMDLLNFCFWSERNSEERFAVDYRGRRWTGYWSLVAALHRALEEDIPITSSDFWQDEDACTDEVLNYVFRSATDEMIPLLKERVDCLREAGQVLYKKYDCRFANCIKAAKGSAAGLVNILAENFSCFRDETTFEGKPVRFLKRAQILVADLWACFEGASYGQFDDIDKITMFADYRLPQALHTLGCLLYSPPLEHHIRQLLPLKSNSPWEIQLRGCSIWCVELIRRAIVRSHPDAVINAVLIDFFLYDTMKEMEREGKETVPHHRTRSIWY